MKAQGLLITVAISTAFLLSAPASAQTACTDDPVAQNDLLNATLWMQRSVEYKANTTAIYALAKIQLDAALADKTWTAATEQTGEFSGPAAGGDPRCRRDGRRQFRL